MIFNKIRYSRLSLKLGFSIGPLVFGYGLVIPHYGSIVVGPSNRIGKYAVLHTSICITDSQKIIGDGLYCSTGCKLIFCGELGHNITIGANCVVSKEFKTNGVLLTSIPCAIKAERVGWYILNDKYAKRVFSVENLKIQMKNRNKTFLIDSIVR